MNGSGLSSTRHRRTAVDLDALTESRRDLKFELQDAAEAVVATESRKRPFRERRRPDIELVATQNRLAQIEQCAERLDREIAALHNSQHRRKSHLVAHSADRIEYETIGAVLDHRIQQNINRSVSDPPSYITRRLGPRPANTTKDRAWVSAVVAVERYRVEHDVTDRRTAIGPEPSGYGQARDRRCADEVILDARDIISPPSQPAQPTRPVIEGPSLDIGL